MLVTLAGLAPTLHHGSDTLAVRRNLRRIGVALRALAASATPGAAGPRLAVLPLGCLSGGAGVRGAWPARPAIRALAKLASEFDWHLVGADHFDGVATGFVVAPGASLILEQRSIGGGAGAASVPVVDTACGRLACLIGEDLLQPEYARLAMFGGAEIIANPCAERLDERSEARHLSRGARAWENHVAIVVAGLGALVDAKGAPSPAHIGRSVAEIWNFDGQLRACGDGPAATATLDCASLRVRRAESWINFPAQLRTGLYAPAYASAAKTEAAARSTQARRKSATVVDVLERAAAEAPAPYDVLMMQTHEVFVGGPDDRDATIADNLERAFALARFFCILPTTRLMVLPEFALQGSDGEHPQAYWERVGIRIPGPETARLGEFARECQVYVCAMVFEIDPDWPQRYFNTSIIVSPEGEVILRYRKLQCADLNGLLNVTTPGNVYTRYIERYGYDGLFPVVDTPIGRLGSLICYDSNWPELWRALALRGAEVICNPTSEIHSDRRPHWYAAKRAHAAEQRCYVAMANAGSEQFRRGAPITTMNRGHSALIDYDGRLAACADGPGVIPLLGRIDLGALRRARARAADEPGRFRASAVARAYERFPGFPLDCFLDRPMELAREGPALVRAQIGRLVERGVFTRP